MLLVKKTTTFRFGDEYRPVKLRVELECYPPPRNPFIHASAVNARLASLVRHYNPELKPTLVFCATRKDALMAAQTVIKSGMLALVSSLERAAALKRAADKTVDQDLKVQ